ncbi:hypothetical protein BDV98DRAFT_233175 [Pterulicium gracile]|uniref:Uncharacterized protein n=1 Tax=Pterulicium gracile TaxID=1884261 RepID=A0A5C3R4C9_9AGAR|nr:hypothetical protein BDV98DRAFT_233175 [Pterula gracilis]
MMPTDSRRLHLYLSAQRARVEEPLSRPTSSFEMCPAGRRQDFRPRRTDTERFLVLPLPF